MKPETSYSYVTLRYVHDIATREFVNVGVVVFSSEANCVDAKMASNLDRVTAMFPDASEEYLRSMLSHIQAQAHILNSQLGSADGSSRRRIQDLVATVLPNDDSSLQWGDIGSGVSRDLRRTVSALFERLVAKYARARPTVHSHPLVFTVCGEVPPLVRAHVQMNATMGARFAPSLHAPLIPTHLQDSSPRGAHLDFYFAGLGTEASG
ncbi:MAG TPA: DUF3037 domain-containing protein [Usitatibacter sp.]|nr:DUF3037 domain-containing protein [Usitatibacter sp.]